MKSHHSDGNGLQALCVGRSPLSAVSKGCPVEFLEPCPPSLHGCCAGGHDRKTSARCPQYSMKSLSTPLNAHANPTGKDA